MRRIGLNFNLLVFFKIRIFGLTVLSTKIHGECRTIFRIVIFPAKIFKKCLSEQNYFQFFYKLLMEFFKTSAFNFLFHFNLSL